MSSRLRVHLIRLSPGTRSLCWPVNKGGGLLTSDIAKVTCRACLHGLAVGRLEAGGRRRG